MIQAITAPGALGDAVNSFLLVFAGLFPIVNPVGCAPIFLGMTSQFTPAERHVLARKVAVNGFFMLLGSLLVGSHVLEFFGITLPVVRVAGGLVVTSFGWKMLNTGVRLEGNHAADAGEPSPGDAFYPLTMPLTVGPGSISVAITLGSQRPKGPDSIAHLALLGGSAMLGLVAMAVTIFLCYRFAEWTEATLGPSGTNVVVRLSAFILLCIGIEIIWSGASTLIGIGAS
jgi:multiple antibiotic resistance protein